MGLCFAVHYLHGLPLNSAIVRLAKLVNVNVCCSTRSLWIWRVCLEPRVRFFTGACVKAGGRLAEASAGQCLHLVFTPQTACRSAFLKLL